MANTRGPFLPGCTETMTNAAVNQLQKLTDNTLKTIKDGSVRVNTWNIVHNANEENNGRLIPQTSAMIRTSNDFDNVLKNHPFCKELQKREIEMRESRTSTYQEGIVAIDLTVTNPKVIQDLSGHTARLQREQANLAARADVERQKEQVQQFKTQAEQSKREAECKSFTQHAQNPNSDPSKTSKNHIEMNSSNPKQAKSMNDDAQKNSLIRHFQGKPDPTSSNDIPLSSSPKPKPR